jgi:hypothetical protein
MKLHGNFAFLIVLAGAALLIGCKPSAVGVSGMAGVNCANCHSGNSSSPYALAFLQNQAAYLQGGHYNGTRSLTVWTGATGNANAFSGSHALSNSQTASGSCNKCHTDQGFVTAIASGGNFYSVGPIPVTSALPPGCFTCHDPHTKGNFTPRTISPVTIYSGGTYNFGKGNLCANCHQARKSAAVDAFPPSAVTWTSSTNPHHGVQSDFLLGSNYWAKPGQSYAGTSPHATATADSCVSCHKYDPYPRSSTNDLQLGGHGFYLMGVGGPHTIGAGLAVQKDVVALCTSCHTPAGPTTTFEGIHPSVPDWANIGGATPDPLVEIRALRDKLVYYFATAANFTAGAPIVPATGAAWSVATPFPVWPGTTIEWKRDFVISSGKSLTLVQAQSFWNLQLYLEDRSGGIHNPVFAAQILYDACVNLGIVVGATRPS